MKQTPEEFIADMVRRCARSAESSQSADVWLQDELTEIAKFEEQTKVSRRKPKGNA